MPYVMIHHVAGILSTDRGIPYTTSSLVPGVCEGPGRQFIRLMLLLERPSGLLGKFWQQLSIDTFDLPFEIDVENSI